MSEEFFDENWPENEKPSNDVVGDAIEKFLAAGFKDEQPITRSWFYGAFGFREPTNLMPFKDAQELQLMFVGVFHRFRERLLEECNLALKSNHGAGSYCVIPAKEQVGWAQKRFDKDLNDAFKSALNRITFLRIEELTPSERAAATDAAANVASMKSHLNAARAASKRRKIHQ